MIKTRIFTAFAAAAILTAGAAPAFAKMKDGQGADSPTEGVGSEAKVCKRLYGVGSKVRSATFCLTPSDWKRFAD